MSKSYSRREGMWCSTVDGETEQIISHTIENALGWSLQDSCSRIEWLLNGVLTASFDKLASIGSNPTTFKKVQQHQKVHWRQEYQYTCARSQERFQECRIDLYIMWQAIYWSHKTYCCMLVS
jgi:hypothetical protein